MANVLDIEMSQSNKQLEALKAKLRDLKKKNQKIDLSKFSFKKSQELLKGVKGNLSDLVIEERNER